MTIPPSDRGQGEATPVPGPAPDDRPVEDVSAIFRLAGRAGCLEVLQALERRGELKVGDLCVELGWGRTMLSLRLMTLRSGSLVAARKVGLTRLYSPSGRGRLVLEAAKVLSRMD